MHEARRRGGGGVGASGQTCVEADRVEACKKDQEIYILVML